MIKFTPWRCNDEGLKTLLDITETLMWEYEELQSKYSNLLSSNSTHTEMLKAQLITFMLNSGDLNEEKTKK